MARNCRKFDEDFKRGAVQLVVEGNTQRREAGVTAKTSPPTTARPAVANTAYAGVATSNRAETTSGPVIIAS